MIGAAALAPSAGAAVDPTIGVRANHNISVFHDIDFVAAFGHELGEPLTVEVFRGGHRIARATGSAVSTPEGGALEVNHGPEGAPVPGDCWPQVTPDIKPFDRIVVTDAAGGQDATLVDDIAFDAGQPAEDPATGDVVLTGHARTANGDPIPVETLEGEFRLTSKLRGAPGAITATDGDGGFRAVYSDPYQMDRNEAGLPPAGIKAALLSPDAEHTIGFGHLAPFATGETQIADNGGLPGPALGCEGSPAAGPNAATATNEDVVNLQSGDLVISGTALAGVNEVSLEISDGETTITRTTNDLASSPGGDDQGWSLALSRADLELLKPEATLTITPSFTGAPPATAAALKVRKDVVRPAPPAADVPEGTQAQATTVNLSSEADARVFFTTDGSTPTAASERFAGPIRVTADTTIRAIAIDAAGNASDMASYTYLIRPPAPEATGASLAAPAPGFALRAAVPAAAPLPELPAPRVTGATVAGQRKSLRAARRVGIVASFVAPQGASIVSAALVRVDGGRRSVVARKPIAASPGRRQKVSFTTASVRRKLRPGRYTVEIRAGRSLSALGAPVSVPLRILR